MVERHLESKSNAKETVHDEVDAMNWKVDSRDRVKRGEMTTC